MNTTLFRICGVFCAALVVVTSVAARDLTFDDRVKAQEAIERVYYAHQIGARAPFEETVPNAILEAKVQRYLRQTSALAALWKIQVTDEMLDRELVRMASGTRMPDRLVELYAALGDDAFLIKECLARATLVDRLARNFYASDRTLHAEAWRRAEVVHAALSKKALSPFTEQPERSVVELSVGERSDGAVSNIVEERDALVIDVPLSETKQSVRVAHYVFPKTSWDAWWDGVGPTLSDESIVAATDGPTAPPVPSGARSASAMACSSDNTWDNATMDDMPEARIHHTAVWTGSVVLIWGGQTSTNGTATALATGGRYDPATDTWTVMSRLGAPSPRTYHTAIWTGSVMVVWGGTGVTSYLATGGKYDPLSDSWTATSTVGAPSARGGHTAVWTGAQMIIWGGEAAGGYPSSGGRYDPSNDSWTPTSTTGAPPGRDFHTAVWTGSVMVVWGGATYNGTSWQYVNTGGRYDPLADTWTATSTAGAPSARSGHTAIWTGSVMVVWGGWNGSSSFDTGARYDPSADAWTPTSTVSAPIARQSHSAVWTGSAMIVWGGMWGYTGGRYDPLADTWSAISNVGAPSGHVGHITVWSGNTMVVWGGQLDNLEMTNTGGRYDPVANHWTATAVFPPVSARYRHTAVWTGSVMVVWGGQDVYTTHLDTGGRYDPAIDAWTATGLVAAPEGRSSHTAVWTGTVMVVWGGYDFYALDSGGRYDPIADIWTSTSTVGAPTARANHTAVWTGDTMVIWGGSTSTVVNTGARYDPVGDSWTSMSTTNAPTARSGHKAVWTGHAMLVWGGVNGSTYPNAGGIYDVSTDTWAPMSTVNAPLGRSSHTAVWTGDKMVVWGGANGGAYLGTGGCYDPEANTWTTTSSLSAPSARYAHTAVWTGNVMVIWGGNPDYASTGRRYDPNTDTWTPTSNVNAPSRRWYHSAVWTGSMMVVWGGDSDVTPPLSSGGRYVLVPPVDADHDGSTVCGGDCDDSNPAIHPGVIETCNGVDDDCNGVVDDGVLAPPETSGMLAAADKSTWGWSATPGATRYDVARGGFGGTFDPHAGDQVCFADLGSATIIDAETPSPGNGFWYLSRGKNACGVGTFGTQSDGAERHPTSCP